MAMKQAAINAEITITAVKMGLSDFLHS